MANASSTRSQRNQQLRSLRTPTGGQDDDAHNEKKTKNTVAFARSPLITSAFVIMAVFFVFFSLAGYAHAEGAPGPGWQLFATSYPTYLVPNQGHGETSGTLGIDVFNIGAGASNGTITVTDVLPAGVKAKEAGQLFRPAYYGSTEFGIDPVIGQGVWDCTGNGQGAAPKVAGATVVTCTNDPVKLQSIQGGGGTPELHTIIL